MPPSAAANTVPAGPGSPSPSDFMPPRTRGLGPSVAMAVLVHAALIGALTWGIAWKRDPQTPVIAAELWAALPVQAAPREQEAPPPPPPPPPPEPARRAEPPPAKEADIALERARKQELERKAREEAQRKADEKKAAQKKAEQKKLEERREEQRQQAEDRKRKEDQRKADERKREAAAEKQREALRDEQLRRMQGLAGATGGAQATGSAERAAGPSASYAGRIVARVKPNIVFTDTVSGNPEAEVEVRAAPDGTIVGKRIVKKSGVDAWDIAVLRALDRTEVLPRDVDGRVPSPMILVFRPRD